MNRLRAALASLLRRPLHTAVAVLTLALGLSAGMGVVTYANGFRKPFPGVDARRLVRVFDATDDDPFGDVSYLDYVDYAQGSGDVLQGLAAIQAGYAASIRHEESTEVVFLEAVSGNAFQLLGVEMSAGRPLTAEDDRPGAEPAAVISHAWWQRRWNGDPGVLGATVYFNFRPHTVVGVASPRFQGSLASYRPDAWLPFEPFKARYTSWDQAAQRRDVPLVRVYGRLAEGVDAERAAERLGALAAGLDEAYPREATRPRRAALAPATWIDPRARAAETGTVRMMLVAAAGLLVLVCANVGNLLLAMAAGRRREMALKAALGASRLRLVGQALLESLLLAVAAAGAALLLAGPAAARLGSYFARPSVWNENVARQMTVDGRVVGFAVLAALAATLLAGLVPALAAGRGDLAAVLKAGDRDGARPATLGGWRVPGAGDLLVSAQVMLSLVLLVVAALTVRSLSNAGSLDSGFDHERLLASYISTSSTGVTVEERGLWFRTLTERLAEEPWVASAALSQQAPLSPHPAARFRMDGVDEDAEMVQATVVAGYFETLGIGVLRGRDFTLADTLGAPGVAVVNEAVARRWLSGGDALGRTLRRVDADGVPGPAYEVVGVVGDARIRDFLVEPEPVVYLANPQQSYASGAALTVAVTLDPAVAAPRLRRWLRAYESHVAIVNVIPYTDVVQGFTYVQRMNAQMFSALALLGSALAVVGIFGVTTLAVTRRTREIGVRMALGARRSDIGRLVLRRVLTSVGPGLVAGAGAALLLSGLVRSLLFGVEPTDPWSLAGAGALFLATALLAALLPARRAASVDPARSLRAD